MVTKDNDIDYADKIREIKDEYGGDKQKAHALMDEVLCEALREHGEGELVEEFENYGKWYA